MFRRSTGAEMSSALSGSDSLRDPTLRKVFSITLLIVVAGLFSALGLRLAASRFKPPAPVPLGKVSAPPARSASSAEDVLPDKPETAIAKPHREPRELHLIEQYDPPDFEFRVFEAMPPEGESWAAVNSLLRSAAQEGDPVAQFGLYAASYRCYRAPRTREELQARKATATAPYYDGSSSYVTSSAESARVAAELDADWRFCLDSDSEQLIRYPDWLESAAASD